MTPDEVRGLELAEFLAFSKLMDDDRREQERQMRKAATRGSRRH